MDQYKIGKFIAECRKEKNLTQMGLAEKLGITDRAISKWENGKAMPDSAIMLELCDVLGITVSDLLNGEKVSSEDYGKRLEEKLVEVINEKEVSDKMLLQFARLACFFTGLFTFVILFLTWDMEDWWVSLIILGWDLLMAFVAGIATKIARVAGYYKCENCGRAYIPTKKEWRWATGWTTKRMKAKCRYCHHRAYHTKVLRKE